MRVIIFTKLPRPGMVKTRLAQSIGFEHAAGLQAAFIRDELRMLSGQGATVHMCCDPFAPISVYMDLFGPNLFYSEQRGADLGERMGNALSEATAHGPVLLIGSDLPDLPSLRISEAWAALDHFQACIGPAPDGGFHLLGVRGPLPENFFAGVKWGGSAVLTETMGAFRAYGINAAILPPWPDVDTYPDLLAYIRRNSGQQSLTMEYVRRHRLGNEA